MGQAVTCLGRPRGRRRRLRVPGGCDGGDEVGGVGVGGAEVGPRSFSERAARSLGILARICTKVQGVAGCPGTATVTGAGTTAAGSHGRAWGA